MTAASTSGALKAYIESLGLGVMAYRDKAPPKASLPHVVIGEGISIVPEVAFNPLADEEGHVRELVQLDVWQAWNPADGQIDSYTLGDELLAQLPRAVIDSPNHVSGVHVVSSARLPDDERHLMRQTITLELRRVLERLSS